MGFMLFVSVCAAQNLSFKPRFLSAHKPPAAGIAWVATAVFKFFKPCRQSVTQIYGFLSTFAEKS